MHIFDLLSYPGCYCMVWLSHVLIERRAGRQAVFAVTDLGATISFYLFVICFLHPCVVLLLQIVKFAGHACLQVDAEP